MGYGISTGHRVGCTGLATLFVIATIWTMIGALAAEPTRIEEDGTIHVPAFDLPESSFLSSETRAVLKRMRDQDMPALTEIYFTSCPLMQDVKRADVPAIRKCQADLFYKTDLYKGVRARYDVIVTPEKIGGVYTEVFTPKQGIALGNQRRVLINVHGGSFTSGARTNSHLESIPIAAVGKIKVISIDYRMAPEYVFPAASEDVAAVYKVLLKTYKPENIGLYGCSAGGMLTAQSMAWFKKNGLPLPGAVGVFCYGAPTADIRGGDGATIDNALTETRIKDLRKSLPDYFHGVEFNTALVAPGDYDEVMAKFPPTLLIGGTRDVALSRVLVTHEQLVRLGVDTELHVWEGMEHAFFYFPDIPESREVYNVIVKFFDKHLGK